MEMIVAEQKHHVNFQVAASGAVLPGWKFGVFDVK
jgi:hypothetical protein